VKLAAGDADIEAAALDGRQSNAGAVAAAEGKGVEAGADERAGGIEVDIAAEFYRAEGEIDVVDLNGVLAEAQQCGERARRARSLGDAEVTNIEAGAGEVDEDANGTVGHGLRHGPQRAGEEFGRVKTHLLEVGDCD